MSISVATDATTLQDTSVERLTSALATTVVVTAKAQTYHWNVTGMAFGPLHALFQGIYEDHFEAQDNLAERIKALGGHADGRLSSGLNRSVIEECDGAISATRMIETLANDQRTLSSVFLELARFADHEGDLVTNDLAIDRASQHDKFAWMLRSHLSD